MKVDVFEKDPIPKAVSKLALPTILGMIVTIVYNLADTFFVGQLKDPYQIAGVTITMPVFIILLSLGYIFGVGGSSFISRLLGNKDFEMAKRTSSFAFYACLALGLVCIGAGVLLINPCLLYTSCWRASRFSGSMTKRSGGSMCPSWWLSTRSLSMGLRFCRIQA